MLYEITQLVCQEMNENYPAFSSVRLKIGNTIRPGLILDNSQITQSVGLITPEQCSSDAAELNAERYVCVCVSGSP